jgi:translation initiation factor IF-2
MLGRHNNNRSDAGSLPGFGADSQRSSNIMRPSAITRPNNVTRPGRSPRDQEGYRSRFKDELPFGVERPPRDGRFGGDRSIRDGRFGADRNDRFGADRNDRYGADRYGGQRQDRSDLGRSSRNFEPEVVQEPEVEAPTPSRFTVQTREKLEDAGYSKKRSAKERDRAKNRRFDDEESAILEEDEAPMTAKELRKAKKAAKRKEVKKELIPIFLPQFISVENLASVLNVRVERFTQHLQELGFDQTSYSHVLNAEEAGLIAGEYGYEPVIDRGEELDLKPRPAPEDKSLLPPRPPVVTIMGHVDHGKTTLLDWLRKSSIAASEHGGITQHIGAFSVTMPSGKIITFLDTPGHAAFLSMRERGANVTDIVILVVAADDSVKPQTIEAIKHAKAANVPMIVAINKVDKENADPERVKNDLARWGVDVEDIGGDTQTVCVSGKTGQGMEELEEATLTLSEILDHRAETDGQIEGWVLEATTKKKGRVATVLVTRGTLKPGDIVVAGRTWAKVRTMTNEFGDEVPSAGPGTPVEIDGWRDHPEAGELAISAETEDRAKEAVEYRIEKAERIKQAVDMEAINEARRAAREKEEAEEEIRRQAEENGQDPDKAVAEAAKLMKEEVAAKSKEVLLIVKADVSGSVEAVVDSVSSLGNDEVKARVLRGSFGAVSEFDIDHAAAAGGTFSPSSLVGTILIQYKPISLHPRLQPPLRPTNLPIRTRPQSRDRVQQRHLPTSRGRKIQACRPSAAQDHYHSNG